MIVLRLNINISNSQSLKLIYYIISHTHTYMRCNAVSRIAWKGLLLGEHQRRLSVGVRYKNVAHTLRGALAGVRTNICAMFILHSASSAVSHFTAFYLMLLALCVRHTLHYFFVINTYIHMYVYPHLCILSSSSCVQISGDGMRSHFMKLY